MADQIDPPPSQVVVDTSLPIWRTWFNNLRDFINTTRSLLTSHTDNTAWNAHGNVATGSLNVANTNLDSSGNEAALVIDKGSFLVGAPTASLTGTTPDINQGGGYFAFIPSSYAVRGGATLGTEWANANIGIASTAFGFNVKASGPFSVALGSNVTSSAQGSIGIGQNTITSTGVGSVAIGDQVTSTGSKSVAIGGSSTANKNGAVAIGVAALGTGNNAVCVGNTSNAGGGFAVALGSSCTASGDNSMTLGKWLNATGTNSVSIGIGASSLSPLNNTNDNTMWIAANTADPTLILQNSRCGVEQKTPLSTLDVGGSVGYDQDILISDNGSNDFSQIYVGVLSLANQASTCTIYNAAGTFVTDGWKANHDVALYNIGSGNTGTYFVISVTEQQVTLVRLGPLGPGWTTTGSGLNGTVLQPDNQSTLSNELTVLVDPDAVNYTTYARQEYYVHLPPISTVNRRMYHIRNKGVLAGRAVSIRPNVPDGDVIDVAILNSTGTDYHLELANGQSVQIVANLTDQTWWII